MANLETKTKLKELLIPGGLTRRIMATMGLSYPMKPATDPAPYLVVSTFIAQLIPYAAVAYGLYSLLK